MTLQTADFPWLTEGFTRVIQQLRQGTLGHALLIGVEQGLGGAVLANDIAAAACCLQPSALGACGHCKSCQLFNAGNHPDCYPVRADGNQIKVDQIRELCQKLTATAQQGGRRIAVIYECERMNTAAANALLKTLEEPGKETLLILQSQTPGRLLPTISSRCQRLKFVAPDLTTLAQWLTRHWGIEEDILWALPVVGGPLPLAEAWQNGRYQQLLALRQDWRRSLTSGHLQGHLLELNEENMIEALNILYLVLRARLTAPGALSPFVRNRIGALAGDVMLQCHQLQLMGNVNYMALCQRFVTDYRAIAQ
ncbi:DNA polymerase III subunit delta' [Shewanella sp. NFH-SH190041]|uniref:DNA polymerase III subunit delta' n=1 Tax=Shewanella sp. NFH-SH190041 TaxID=2950245 RepID=UPI0021C28DAF|nr:DNA polymerase III subunit delta' [Shewanella sp. NFH-SH190041]BDM64684.1 DNA polymerase III subunit delta' [Shewanella sp. NFH-SH190041]